MINESFDNVLIITADINNSRGAMQSQVERGDRLVVTVSEDEAW